jgi:hypothetical protein
MIHAADIIVKGIYSQSKDEITDEITFQILNATLREYLTFRSKQHEQERKTNLQSPLSHIPENYNTSEGGDSENSIEPVAHRDSEEIVETPQSVSYPGSRNAEVPSHKRQRNEDTTEGAFPYSQSEESAPSHKKTRRIAGV